MQNRLDETVIIGGGQAGLATAYHLQCHNLPCIILDENDEVGAAWRMRWDALRLFTPGRYNNLPGMPYPGPPKSLPGKDEIADYLQAYAARFNLPIKTGVKVTRLRIGNGNFILDTTLAPILAHNVVVSTGAFHHPRIPGFSNHLSTHIVQMHSSEYKNPSQLQSGPVLVVGAGQSGAEIALELARTHKVWISGRDPGEEPFIQGTLADRLFTPIMVFAASKVINVANPLGRKLRRHFFHPPRGIPRAGGTKKLLQKAGIEWVGRTTGTSDGYPALEDGQVIQAVNVIWCTGFVPNYQWIELPIFNEFGYPVHHKGVIRSHPGMYFVGLPFQRTLSSTLILGVGKDAGYIADQIAAKRNGVHRYRNTTAENKTKLERGQVNINKCNELEIVKIKGSNRK